MSNLSWRHHTLIQALLSRGPLQESEFHSIFSGITGKNPVAHRQLFNDVLLKLNKALEYVQFELRGSRNQYDGKVYYGVVNKVADEQSKLGTKYSVLQIAFFKAVIEAIVQDISTQGCITNIEALNIRLGNQAQAGNGSEGSQPIFSSAFKSFSISQKEKTLNDLIQDRWLCSTPDGKVGLGVRSFLDLRSWFHNNEIPSCDVCNEAGVKAFTCPNDGCSIRIHDYCLKKKFSQRKVARVCPGCGTAWDLPELAVEEEAEPEPTEGKSSENRATRNKSSENRATRNRARKVKAEAVEAAASGSGQRKRLRSCKAEVVDAVQAKVEESSIGPSRPRASQRLRRR